MLYLFCKRQSRRNSVTQSYRDYSSWNVSQLPQYKCFVLRFFYTMAQHFLYRSAGA